MTSSQWCHCVKACPHTQAASCEHPAQLAFCHADVFSEVLAQQNGSPTEAFAQARVSQSPAPSSADFFSSLCHSSFITFLRASGRAHWSSLPCQHTCVTPPLCSTDAAPEILQSAARSMKHLLDTQASDVYDRDPHDRLCSIARHPLEPAKHLLPRSSFTRVHPHPEQRPRSISARASRGSTTPASRPSS